MLNGRVQIHDIHDSEAFVVATINTTGLNLTDEEWDELRAEGLAILWRMSTMYETRRAGHNQDGRFSGYAARYLRGKIIDAWHNLHPEHISWKQNGIRGRTYGDAPLSLQGLMGARGIDTDHDTRPEDTITALRADDPTALVNLGGPRRMNGNGHTIGTIAQASSALLRRIHAALHTRIEEELDFTVQVAVLRGLDVPRAEIETQLQASEVAVRGAMERLRKVGLDLGTP